MRNIMKTASRTALKRLVLGSILVLAGAPAFAIEHGAMDHGAMDQARMESRAATTMTEGEVRKVDVELGKVTIRHAEIMNLAMPAMTMVFTATDLGLLSEVRPGDKIRFAAVNENGKLLVTAIETLPVD
jgi:Cu(I)/Ag(I) efflux system protein CusF